MNTPSPIFGPTNPSPADQAAAGVRRFGAIIGLRPEKEAYYRQLHSQVWDSIQHRLRLSHVRNYSIFLGSVSGITCLFSYLEYTGTDYQADMQAVAADPETQRWWKETDPCQFEIGSTADAPRWTPLELVFHMDA